MERRRSIPNIPSSPHHLEYVVKIMTTPTVDRKDTATSFHTVRCAWFVIAQKIYPIFSAKLVLEVFGGTGAIWGFSEAIGLRTTETLWFWRPCALIVGVIFFVRWCRQIREYVICNEKEFYRKQQTTKSIAGSKSSETLELTSELDESHIVSNGYGSYK